MVFTVSLLIVGVIGLPRAALAYVDPGSGSYLLQLLLGGLLGAAFALRMGWGRIRTFFTKLFSSQGEEH